MQQQLMFLLVLFYIIQIIVCFAVLAMQPDDDDVKVFKTKRGFFLSLIPYLWVIPAIKLFITSVKDAWEQLS